MESQKFRTSQQTFCAIDDAIVVHWTVFQKPAMSKRGSVDLKNGANWPCNMMVQLWVSGGRWARLWFLMTSPMQEFYCCNHFSLSNRCITTVSTEVTLWMLRTVEIDYSIFRLRGLGTMTRRNVQKFFLLYILLRSHTAPSGNKFDDISCGSAGRLKFYKKKDMNKLWNYSEMIVFEYEARCAFDPV